MTQNTRETLTHLFLRGVDAVVGDSAVKHWLDQHETARPSQVLAVGKAAVAMFLGLPKTWRENTPSLIVTKTGHIGNTKFSAQVVALEASHPVPDQSSIDAGQRATNFVENCPADSHLLMLVSGGASALVEHLNKGVTFEDLAQLTETALAEGADIGEINRRRKQISAIKGGGLLGMFKGRKVSVLAISDVAGDSIDVIGSGIGGCPDQPAFTYEGHIIASNAVARAAVEEAATKAVLPVVTNQETMYADIAVVAEQIASDLRNGPNGLYIYGGEPTVVLPENPGQGGRNQALALEIARLIQGQEGITGLVAGTDGTDGPTEAAGALLDGKTYTRAPGVKAAQIAADSGSYLAKTGELLTTGPTGTNVMDLALFTKTT
jgi:hydroxypyruvate reductase